jgi:hypothetical protein
MTKYYLAKLETIANPRDPNRLLRRAAVARYTCNHTVASIPLDPVTGDQLFNWCLVLVDVDDDSALLADPDIIELGTVDQITALWSSLSNTQQNRITNAINKLNINISPITNTDTCGDIIDKICRNQDANCDYRRMQIAKFIRGS